MLVESLPVVVLHAVDPDRAEQTQVLVKQAELHRDVAQGRVLGQPGIAVQQPGGAARRAGPSEPRKSVRIGEASKAMRTRPTPRT